MSLYPSDATALPSDSASAMEAVRDQPSGEPPRTRHRGLLGLIGIALAVLIGAAIVATYVLRFLGRPGYRTQSMPCQQPALSCATTAAVSPSVTRTAPELGDFPVYPGAVFSWKTVYVNGTCSEEQPLPDKRCHNAYSFDINDSYLHVYNWYMKQAQGAWTCRGGYGAGSDTAGALTTSCMEGALAYYLTIDGNEQAAHITVLIPVK